MFKLKKRLLTLGLSVGISAFSISGCQNLNNPFYPRAELTVTSISSGGGDGKDGIGISQALDLSASSVSYTFNNPNVTIANRPGLPRVIFKQVVVNYTVGETKIPSVRFPTLITVPAGGTFSGTISVLSQKETLVNTVYPNNTTASSGTGTAEISLIGVDDNGYVQVLQIVAPLLFSSTVTGSAPVATPSGTNP